MHRAILLIALVSTITASAGSMLAARADEPAAAGALTKDSLKTLLENLGYTTKPYGDKGYEISVNQGGRSWVVDAELSPSDSKLWFIAWLDKVPDPSKVPAAPLVQLLMKNDEIDPTHFEMKKSGNDTWLQLVRHTDNRGVTPPIIRQELDSFGGHIASTRDLWNVSKWTAAPTQ